MRMGFRICFDMRFPEPFRALYVQGTDLCVVAFSDSAEQPDPARYDQICAHLMTRAVENVMTVASVNTLSRQQTAPNAVIDPSGAGGAGREAGRRKAARMGRPAGAGYIRQPRAKGQQRPADGGLEATIKKDPAMAGSMRRAMHQQPPRRSMGIWGIPSSR